MTTDAVVAKGSRWDYEARAGQLVTLLGSTPAGDIVILAVPYSSAATVVAEYGDALDGKVVVDITNPISPDLTSLVIPQAVLVRRRSLRAPRQRACREGFQHRPRASSGWSSGCVHRSR
jgi:hypothetical protein